MVNKSHQPKSSVEPSIVYSRPNGQYIYGKVDHLYIYIYIYSYSAHKKISKNVGIREAFFFLRVQLISQEHLIKANGKPVLD